MMYFNVYCFTLPTGGWHGLLAGRKCNVQKGWNGWKCNRGMEWKGGWNKCNRSAWECNEVQKYNGIAQNYHWGDGSEYRSATLEWLKVE